MLQARAAQDFARPPIVTTSPALVAESYFLRAVLRGPPDRFVACGLARCGRFSSRSAIAPRPDGLAEG